MEDVLDLYAEPFDPKRPVVCFDEKPLQLLEETRVSRPCAPGQPALMDHGYRRKGTANIFMAVEPRRGWRRVTVTERRTKVAAEMEQLVDVGRDSIQAPSASRWCWITSTRTSSPACTRPILPLSHGVSRAGWSFTTHPNTAVG